MGKLNMLILWCRRFAVSFFKRRLCSEHRELHDLPAMLSAE